MSRNPRISFVFVCLLAGAAGAACGGGGGESTPPPPTPAEPTPAEPTPPAADFTRTEGGGTLQFEDRDGTVAVAVEPNQVTFQAAGTTAVWYWDAKAKARMLDPERQTPPLRDLGPSNPVRAIPFGRINALFSEVAAGNPDAAGAAREADVAGRLLAEINQRAQEVEAGPPKPVTEDRPSDPPKAPAVAENECRATSDKSWKASAVDGSLNFTVIPLTIEGTIAKNEGSSRCLVPPPEGCDAAPSAGTEGKIESTNMPTQAEVNTLCGKGVTDNWDKAEKLEGTLNTTASNPPKGCSSGERDQLTVVGVEVKYNNAKIGTLSVGSVQGNMVAKSRVSLKFTAVGCFDETLDDEAKMGSLTAGEVIACYDQSCPQTP